MDICKDIFKKLFDQPFITVKLHNCEYGQPAALIVNDTDKLLMYSKPCTFERNNYYISALRPKHSVFYHLNDGAQDAMTLWSSENLVIMKITLNWDSLKVERLPWGIYYLSFWDGPQRVVLLKENEQPLNRLVVSDGSSFLFCMSNKLPIGTFILRKL